ncbi:hypothetical protein [Aquimarina sp. MAR_2010_214]|uniref:hypothetical protein n=1 Tax=Aquimarina sp. MAR_2010_214 TaxID=1250026 RepID=UPI001177BACA|nr:hypothetical protein [Aquimarina sp. MAR_2010_214]
MRKIYRVEHWEQIYFNNQPLLLHDPKFLSASLFIMTLNEWKTQFRKDIKNSHLKGTDARSIRDMVKTCFELGLERSNYNEFYSYYDNLNIDHNGINRWIYDDFKIYKEVIDQDYSIVTLKEALKRSKNKNPLYISNKLSQKALKLAMETFWTEYMPKDYNNTFFRLFIQQCTVYKKNVPESFYIKEIFDFQEYTTNLTIEELSDFVGLLKFFSNESIILNLNANRLYENLIKSFPDIKLLIGDVTFRTKLYKKSDFSNEIKYDLKTILDKLINK